MANPEVSWTTNATSALTTPTYDGSGEAVHPDVYDAGSGNTWNGYRYWMAMTPYPDSDATKETPSILASADGTTWVVPGGLTNPIDGPGAGDSFSDADLIRVGDDLYCFYRHNAAGGNPESVFCKVSSDGVNWGVRQTILTGSLHEFLSPTVVEVDGAYQMYTVNVQGATHVITRRTASDPLGPWSDPVTLTVDPARDNVWHLDVINDGGTLCGVITTQTPYALHYAELDGDTWYMSADAVLEPLGGAVWDATWIYRSTIVRNDDGFDLWYSALDRNGTDVWHIGRTQLYMWPWNQNEKQLYILMENLDLAGYQLDHLLLMMQAAGEYRTMPAYINHRRSIDANTRLYEARMNTDMLTAASFQDRLGLLLDVAPGSIGVTTTSPDYAGHGSTKMVFDDGADDQCSVTIYGTVTGTWEQSRAECMADLGL